MLWCDLTVVAEVGGIPLIVRTALVFSGCSGGKYPLIVRLVWCFLAVVEGNLLIVRLVWCSLAVVEEISTNCETGLVFFSSNGGIHSIIVRLVWYSLDALEGKIH